MDELAALGAKAILTTDIRSCRALKSNGEARSDREDGSPAAASGRALARGRRRASRGRAGARRPTPGTATRSRTTRTTGPGSAGSRPWRPRCGSRSRSRPGCGRSGAAAPRPGRSVSASGPVRYSSRSSAGTTPRRQQQHERVELHLEQRPRLGDGARRGAGLVVDHADPAPSGRHVDAVDVAPQQQPGLQLDLDQQLPRLGLEQARIFEREVGVEQGVRAGEPHVGLRLVGHAGLGSAAFRSARFGSGGFGNGGFGNGGFGDGAVGNGASLHSAFLRAVLPGSAGTGLPTQCGTAAGRRRSSCAHAGATSSRAAAGTRSAAGRGRAVPARRARACPRTCAAPGISGRRSIARNR